ncbi:DNA-binding response regulator [Paenibacillus cymbidii]|uniref:DNA-binding response regulator n=1 Tax=Paenibacillus cymbidii TaxID=1639034 RepID=UPI00108181E4|nr:DNA-binding response regulator [Paenibacillus cymbidii]
MSFEEAYEAFIRHHRESSDGERRRRLREGLGFLEKLFLQRVWWLAIGNFQHLHPEYEVQDFADGVRYLDFAYLRAPYKIKFALDGFGPHLRDVDRWKFGDGLMRQNHLILDGWQVYRFSSDDIEHKPRRCQQFLLHVMGRCYGDAAAQAELSLKEKEVLRYIAMAMRPITPKLQAEHLGVHAENARQSLQGLCHKRLLRGAGGSERIRAYELDDAGRRLFL